MRKMRGCESWLGSQVENKLKSRYFVLCGIRCRNNFERKEVTCWNNAFVRVLNKYFKIIFIFYVVIAGDIH